MYANDGSTLKAHARCMQITIAKCLTPVKAGFGGTDYTRRIKCFPLAVHMRIYHRMEGVLICAGKLAWKQYLEMYIRCFSQ